MHWILNGDLLLSTAFEMDSSVYKYFTLNKTMRLNNKPHWQNALPPSDRRHRRCSPPVNLFSNLDQPSITS